MVNDVGAIIASAKIRNGKEMVLRLCRGLFGVSNDNFSTTFQQLSRQEASVQARLKLRQHSSAATLRNVVTISFVLQVAAVGFAIMTRDMELNWQMRAVHLLPMFVIPVLSVAVYWILTSLTRMFDIKDRKTLARLQAERQGKIDELEEKTQYYTTHQLIQKYDIDPAAESAAATVWPSNLSSDSGLRVHVGEESNLHASSGKSNGIELIQSTGLRHRRPHARGRRFESHRIENLQSSHPTRGWLARVAALLVGEDPAQCYALICSDCYVHNGLARKEDLERITYYCPRCHALNVSRHLENEEHKTNSVVESATESIITTGQEHSEEKAGKELYDLAG